MKKQNEDDFKIVTIYLNGWVLSIITLSAKTMRDINHIGHTWPAQVANSLAHSSWNCEKSSAHLGTCEVLFTKHLFVSLSIWLLLLFCLPQPLWFLSEEWIIDIAIALFINEHHCEMLFGLFSKCIPMIFAFGHRTDLSLEIFLSFHLWTRAMSLWELFSF